MVVECLDDHNAPDGLYKHYLHLFNDDLTDAMDRLAAVASRPAMARIG